MKTIITDHFSPLTPKAFQKPHKTVDTTINTRTLERKMLPFITPKISKEYAKGNFQHTAFKAHINHPPIFLKERLYVRAKLSI
ncbi:hypothetical protein CER18_04935 [Bartonella tribocorum]|uniref:Uncharacterized protein n=1 Tax=Bartonella tribocorum TaxID=85701 RepID=A0A2M6US42_9HYPH|nr:hypothetical protein CER18_04935 [Bartonella tribocorum]